MARFGEGNIDGGSYEGRFRTGGKEGTLSCGKCGVLVSSILDGLVSGDGEDTGKVEWNTRNAINGWSKLKSPQNGPTEAKDQFSEDDEIEM